MLTAISCGNRPVCEGAPLLGQYAEDLIRDAVATGYLNE